jgi:hypothetical protein
LDQISILVIGYGSTPLENDQVTPTFIPRYPGYRQIRDGHHSAVGAPGVISACQVRMEKRS